MSIPNKYNTKWLNWEKKSIKKKTTSKLGKPIKLCNPDYANKIT
jgi:hypothetical protein